MGGSAATICISWPCPTRSFDAVVIHQVLHYADRPAAAIAEAARVLRPQGILVIVDFAPHGLEFLREEHAHRRLGFADGEIAEWCRAAGLHPAPPRLLPGDPLTVAIWSARRSPPAHLQLGRNIEEASSAILEGELR